MNASIRSVVHISCCVFSLFLLVGCVRNEAYRRQVDAKAINQTPPPELQTTVEPILDNVCENIPRTSCIKLDGEMHPQKFYLAYIEFDDMGELWSIGNLDHPEGKSPEGTSQLSAALHIIDLAKQKARKEGKPLYVVTFVHGWHNNDSSYDERHKNLEGFKREMQALAVQPSSPVIVGVFIAWRGQSVMGDPFLTYWNRRDAATRVGGPSMTEVLFKLMLRTKGVPSLPGPADNPCQPQVKDQYAHFFAVGHSFGARVLEHAMGQPLLAMLLEQQSEVEGCVQRWPDKYPDQTSMPTLLSPADLIVFLNPANDAFETKSMIEAFKRSRITEHQQNNTTDFAPTYHGPLLVSVISEGDFATRKLMPLAQGLSTAGVTFRKYDNKNCEEGQLDLHYQTFFWRQSDGDIEQMHSHDVKEVPPDSVAINQCKNDWYFTVNNRCFRIERLAETEKNGKRSECYKDQDSHPWNDTPFWVVGVHKDVIPNHTDIFQPATVSLIRSLAATKNLADSSETAQAASAVAGPIH